MTFPVYINLGIFTVHPHLLFETLAYFIGFRVYLYTKTKGSMPTNKAVWVAIGAILGAAIGSKLLYWFESPVETIENLFNIVYMMEGKTIVGGLLGGLIGVEWMKKRIGWSRSTGDDFVLPLIVGMTIGRIGCFLTGLSDHTYGTETRLPFGVDFGDGVMRHPTQLYEIVFLLILGISIMIIKRKGLQRWEGFLFQLFMIGYLGFRLWIDFIKPTPHPYLLLNNIQVAAILGLIYYFFLIQKKRKEHRLQSISSK